MENNHEPNDMSGDRHFLIDIIQTLEDHGVAQDEIRLNDVVDPEALEQLVDSANVEIEVTFTVSNVRLSVTEDRVATTERLEDE